ncbi:HalOD1 output domain-containing protein [Natrialbaceae archaeon A-gly3]
MYTDTPVDASRLRQVGDAVGTPVYYDEQRGTYHTWYDEKTYEPVSTTVLAALTAVVDVEIEDLEGIRAYVDPDALNALFDHWGSRTERIDSGSVSFPFAECIVTVRTNGEIEIDPENHTVR